MNFIERQLTKIGLIFARKKLEGIMGKNWKGKTGGVVSMLSGSILILTGVSCFLQAFTGDAQMELTQCMAKISEGVGLFGLGLGAFGIRQALGKQ